MLNYYTVCNQDISDDFQSYINKYYTELDRKYFCEGADDDGKAELCAKRNIMQEGTVLT